MEDEIDRLKNRIGVLEEMVECLLGKAFADSGQMALLIDDIVEHNAEAEATLSGAAAISSHRHMVEHLARRRNGGQFRAQYFPRKWKQARRLRETTWPL